tara:strand:- start:194 stop:493 length:300 start_codon:yes stop_codon:yes gene_type:complete
MWDVRLETQGADMILAPTQKISAFKFLRIALGLLAVASCGFGVYLIVAAILLGFEHSSWGQNGSRAFFMSLSGLTLLVFGGGFVMMIRELSGHIRKLTP